MGGDQTREETLKLVSRLMQAGMVAIALAGIVTGNLTWLPAAFVALLISEVPSILARDLKLVLPFQFNFLIVFALFLHVVGGYYGFYDDIPWWDHLTHATSASLVAAIGLVFVVSVDRYVETIYLPRRFLAFFVIMFTMSFGVLWELMEFATDELTGSMLQYSLDDSMLDLLFDGFAGFIVASASTHYIFEHSTPDKFAEDFDLKEAGHRLKRLVKRFRRGNKKKNDARRGAS